MKRQRDINYSPDLLRHRAKGFSKTSRNMLNITDVFLLRILTCRWISGIQLGMIRHVEACKYVLTV